MVYNHETFSFVGFMRVCWHVFWIGFQGPSDQRRIFSRPEQRQVSELTFKTSFFYDLDRTLLLEVWLENGSGISNRNNKKRMITRKGRLRNVKNRKNPIFESTQRSSNPIFTWLEFDSPVLLLVVIEYIHYTIVSIFWLQLR